MQALNLALFQVLGAGHDPQPQLLWFAAAVAKNSSWLCVALMGWAVWRHPSQRAYVVAALVAAAAASVLAHELADAFGMPRPFTMGLSPAHIEHGARGSMPSAHASVMFTVALVFLLRAPLRALGWGLLLIAALTGWARVYVGVHFPFDIVAGLLLAIAIAAVLWALLRLRGRHRAPARSVSRD
ncbi:MAG: phosphatase PAP2 family protein [Variovorax sp.]|nr:MAG: phosphatase PAP2 family protein [Variovorax sp.]